LGYIQFRRSTVKEGKMKRKDGYPNPLANFNILFFISLSITVLFSIAGCGTNSILNADFDQYDDTPQDFQVVGDIPGPPAGDTISAWVPIIAVTNDAALPGKNLLVGGDINTQEFGAKVDFKTAAHSTPDEYRIQWYGRREFASNSALTSITFLDSSLSSAHEALRLKFSGPDASDVRLIQFETGDNPPPAPIFYEFDNKNPAHTILITLHMASRTIDVTFAPELITPPNAPGGEDWPNPKKHTGLHFKDPDFSGLDIIRVEVKPGSGAYYIDQLKVFTKNEK
jgi:hypothetical protein